VIGHRSNALLSTMLRPHPAVQHRKAQHPAVQH
jgi:hypothetical protein